MATVTIPTATSIALNTKRAAQESCCVAIYNYGANAITVADSATITVGQGHVVAATNGQLILTGVTTALFARAATADTAVSVIVC
jgi:hypothetical protein